MRVRIAGFETPFGRMLGNDGAHAWTRVAGIRVRRGDERFTYSIDVAGKRIVCDLAGASAGLPCRCVDAGRDASHEVKDFPEEVGAVASEDEDGSVRFFYAITTTRAGT